MSKEKILDMKNKKIMLILLVLGVTITTKAQTVSNTGLLHISPGTTMGIMHDFDNRETGTLWNDGELYLFSSFNNDGLVSFAPDEKGHTRFEGFSQQKITGTLPVDFKNVLFNNVSAQPAIELFGDISIAGDANFSNGIVSNEFAGGLMIFEKEANHSNTSHSSHVDGNVKRNGENEFTYPIGHKEFYRHAAIEATSDALSSFTSNYFHENSDALYPHASKAGIIDVINDQEYWILEKHSGTADAVLTLSWDETTTTPGHIVTEEEELHIVRWDPVQNLWVDNGGIVDMDKKTVTTPINVSGYSVFTLARVKSSKIIKPCNNLVIYNALSPNGDGINDFLRIDGLDTCSKGENTIQIFNRWGVKVYETRNYGVDGNVFRGYSHGRTTVSKSDVLPSGTYFYVLSLEYKGADNNAQTINKSGYLYIN